MRVPFSFIATTISRFARFSVWRTINLDTRPWHDSQPSRRAEGEKFHPSSFQFTDGESSWNVEELRGGEKFPNYIIITSRESVQKKVSHCRYWKFQQLFISLRLLLSPISRVGFVLMLVGSSVCSFHSIFVSDKRALNHTQVDSLLDIPIENSD